MWLVGQSEITFPPQSSDCRSCEEHGGCDDHLDPCHRRNDLPVQHLSLRSAQTGDVKYRPIRPTGFSTTRVRGGRSARRGLGEKRGTRSGPSSRTRVTAPEPSTGRTIVRLRMRYGLGSAAEGWSRRLGLRRRTARHGAVRGSRVPRIVREFRRTRTAPHRGPTPLVSRPLKCDAIRPLRVPGGAAASPPRASYTRGAEREVQVRARQLRRGLR